MLRAGPPGGAALDDLLSHLDHCPTCLDAVRDLPPDPLCSLADRLTEPEAPAVQALIQRLDHLGHSAAPERVGDYRLLHVLGRGGMGVVYEAEDERLQRRVALKLMAPELAASATARGHILAEARAAARIRDDAVVAIYQCGEDDGIAYVAMELLVGEPLEKRLRGGWRPSPAEVVRLARETAQGLAAAHARGLIHRDVKPGNIFLEDRPGGWRVKLLDFGIACGDDVTAEAGGPTAGTPGYMAPEQTRGEPLDARADLFALGRVLERLCEGTRPPPRLAALINRLVSDDRAARPASARAVLDELDAIDRPRPQRWRVGAAVAVAALAGAVALAALLWPRPGPPADPPARPGYALELTGDGRVELPALPLDTSRPFTLEVWATPTVLSPRRGVLLAACGKEGEAPRNLSLEISSYRRPPTYLYSWRFPNNLGSRRAEEGRRVHLAAVHEARRVRLFVDGELNEMRDGLGPLAEDGGVRFWVGYRFHGRIDHVRISQAARYRQEFRPTRPHESDAHTLALYAFEEEGGDTLRDSSGHGHHGRIVNARWVARPD